MENLINEIESKLTELVTLQIVTAVGDVSVSIDNKNVSAINISSGNSAMVSRLNLLTGDQATYFATEFVTGDYTSLQSYHADQEKNGLQRVQDNIAALRKLIDLARDVEKEKANPAAAPATQPPANPPA